MVKYDGEKWIPETEEEIPEAGYGVLRTLLKHGPTPTARRLFQPQEYEQAVLKFMANEKCSRDVAQGNMDFYLRNPNDWFAIRMDEEKNGYKFDFVSLDSKKVALVTVWTGLIVLFVEQFYERIQTGDIDFVSEIAG